MKIGLDQINRPEPNWMRSIFNILVIAILPAFAVYIISVPESYIHADTKNFIGATTTFLVAVLQALRELSGKDNSKTNAA